MRISAYLMTLFSLCVVVSCGDDEVASNDVDAGQPEVFRPETEAPQTPNASTNGDPNNGSTDAGMPDGGVEDCTGPAECVLGADECAGAQIRRCLDDGDGDNCGELDVGRNCDSPQQSCLDGACVADDDCIDNDNDGYGTNCALGPDCDDTNPDRFPGNPEVCDGIDNDCSAGADDTAGLGGTCTSGSGACMGTGVPACDGTMLVCNVTNPGGSPEVCDQVDNDCDGQVDEGNVCMMCAADAFEANDTAAAAASLTMNTRNDGTICGADEDWFSFPTTNKVYRVSITFPNSQSDLDLEIYEDGALFDSSLSAFDDTEVIQFRASQNSNYTARVFNAGSDDNFYFAQVLDVVACQQEDGFAPNQTIAQAAPMPAGWAVYGYACDGQSDFYDMGEVQMGETVTVNLYDVDFGDDLDLYLWADPDGDGQFDRVDDSRGPNSNETITYTSTHTGNFYYEVTDFGGFGALYDMDWTR